MSYFTSLCFILPIGKTSEMTRLPLGLWGGLNEGLYVKPLEQWLAHISNNSVLATAIIYLVMCLLSGFPDGTSDKEPTC